MRAIAFVVLFVFSASTGLAAAKCTSVNATAVEVAFLRHSPVNLKVTPLTIGQPIVVCPYALQPWSTTNGGGEALLKYTAKGWAYVTGGGGEPEVPDLVMMGVPKAVAERLIQKRNQQTH